METAGNVTVSTAHLRHNGLTVVRKRKKFLATLDVLTKSYIQSWLLKNPTF